ncbi:prolinetRNA ligase [Striga asiatica]|uniref:ProlinetRNA ligase n=1 Tax=Striga asiatica TaxID=4170 RepID=A0A5A7PX51_STRAF|nr:prolinetRNA ligase [Striga asiatica]
MKSKLAVRGVDGTDGEGGGRLLWELSPGLEEESEESRVVACTILWRDGNPLSHAVGKELRRQPPHFPDSGHPRLNGLDDGATEDKKYHLRKAAPNTTTSSAFRRHLNHLRKTTPHLIRPHPPPPSRRIPSLHRNFHQKDLNNTHPGHRHHH